MELFGGRYEKVHIYDNPTTLTLGGCKFALVPWINKEHEAACLGFMEDSDAKIVCGHFELNGYQVMRGVQHSGGLDPVYVKSLIVFLLVTFIKSTNGTTCITSHSISNDIHPLEERFSHLRHRNR